MNNDNSNLNPNLSVNTNTVTNNDTPKIVSASDFGHVAPVTTVNSNTQSIPPVSQANNIGGSSLQNNSIPNNIQNTQTVPVNNIQQNVQQPQVTISNNNTQVDVPQSRVDIAEIGGKEENVVPNLSEAYNMNNNNNNKEHKEVEYKPPGKLKIFGTILIFVLMLFFIIYIDQVPYYIQLFKEKVLKQTPEVEEIVSGKAVCSLSSNTTNLNREYTRTFYFQDNKLESSNFETVIKGDVSEDEKYLDDLSKKCILLRNEVDKLSGISVECEYLSGVVTKNERFEYKEYDSELVKVAYIEAGGEMLEFKNGENIDDILKLMSQQGFSCAKEK